MSYILIYDDPDLDSPSFGIFDSLDRALEEYYNMLDSLRYSGRPCYVYLSECRGSVCKSLLYSLVNPYTGGNCDDN